MIEKVVKKVQVTTQKETYHCTDCDLEFNDKWSAYSHYTTKHSELIEQSNGYCKFKSHEQLECYRNAGWFSDIDWQGPGWYGEHKSFDEDGDEILRWSPVASIEKTLLIDLKRQISLIRRIRTLSK